MANPNDPSPTDSPTDPDETSAQKTTEHETAADAERTAAHFGESTVAYVPGSSQVGAASTVETGLLAGRYRLGPPLGEGGMGSVYRAEQVHPVRRPVAIKLIRVGMDSARVVARFDAERQALAVMDHPNIAKVFDAGTAPDGRPFFVMELVEGRPLTAYCDENRLSVPDRLALFVQVCQAVQHAHQKGVIHRDLKPGNILVTELDGRPVPKVIDFGLAKALDAGILPDVSLDGTVLGTPLYMSPEQADPATVDIDTRADIYALGVILYEILTGSTPISRESLHRAAVSEMLRAVREDDPPTPVQRLDSAETLPSIAAVRRIEPAKLKKLIRGDLEWVTMKCLEKERGRRYETANALAAEVQRYLADEPVMAGPQSRWYRLRKFVRRNKGPVVAASLVLLTLIGGIVGTSLGLVEADRQRREAETQRALAEKRHKQTREALDAATDEAILSLLGGREKLTDKERNYLENAAKRYEAFAQEAGDTHEARAFRASGDARIGVIHYRLGLMKEAEAAHRAALAIRKQLAAEHPEVVAYRADLADSHHELGMVFDNTSRMKEAEREFLVALAIREKLVADHPEVPEYQNELGRSHGNLAILYRLTGRPKDAETSYRAAEKAFEKLAAKHPDDEYRKELVRTRDNLGLMFQDTDRLKESEELHLAVLRGRTELAAAHPDDPEYRLDLADTHHNLAMLYRVTKRPKEAEEQHLAGLAIRETLARANPAVARYQVAWAVSHNNLGLLFKDTDRAEKAKASYEAAANIYEQLTTADPSVAIYKVYLAAARINLASILRDEGRPAEGLPLYGQGIALVTAVLEKEPNNMTAQQFLRNGHVGTAQALEALGRHAESAAAWRKALELAPESIRSAIQANLALALARAGDTRAAVAEADLMTKHPMTAASVYAMCSAHESTSATDREAWQVKAIRKLELAKGEPDFAETLRADSNLDSLRGRADFKALEQAASSPQATDKK